MDPLTAISSGLSATKTGFDLIKSVRELMKRPEVDTSEILARLTELQDLMLNAKLALVEADEENKRLHSKIAELTRMADFGKEFKAAHGVYWRETFPYCPVCWDVERKPVRLSGPIRMPDGGPIELWTCPFHKQAISLGWHVRSEMMKQQNA